MSASSDLQILAHQIVPRFETVTTVRDQALTAGRQITRLSANAVRAIHRGEFAVAEALIAEAGSAAAALIALVTPLPAIAWAGYVQDALKEYAEASITYAIVHGDAIPSPDALGVADAAYLNALAEAASELRREVLDCLRRAEYERAEALLGTMDTVYDLLVTIDFPDAITGGLRRTTDQLRAVLERTRGDLTVTLRQHHLERALRDALARLTEHDQADPVNTPDRTPTSR